jgi:tetratricopeptide (TPR) repeat protein
LHELRKQLLDEAGKFYEQLIQRQSDDPAMRGVLADAYAKFATVAQWNGDRIKAVQRLQQALDVFQKMPASELHTPPYQLKLASAHQAIAGLQEEQGAHQLAERSLQEAERVLDPLVKAHPADPRYKQALAELLYGRGNLYLATEKYTQAEGGFDQSLALYKELAPNTREFDYRQKRAACLINLGIVYQHTNRPDQAEGAWKEAGRLFKVISDEQPDNSWWQSGQGRSLWNLGVLYAATGRPDQAEKAYADARAIYQKLSASDPEMTRWQESLISILTNEARLYAATGRKGQALSAYEEVCALGEKLSREFPREKQYALQLGVNYAMLGALLKDNSKPEAAARRFTQALQALEAVLGKEPRESELRELLRNVYESRAEALTLAGRHAEALQDYDRALALDTGPRRDHLRTNRACALARAGDHERATAEGKLLAGDRTLPFSTLYDLACVYAVASAAARQDAKLPEPERGKLGEQHADRAMELLRAAVAKGYKDGAHMKKDPDLDPLRRRDDFQKLLAGLSDKP